jgi:hypothetical protein
MSWKRLRKLVVGQIDVAFQEEKFGPFVRRKPLPERLAVLNSVTYHQGPWALMKQEAQLDVCHLFQLPLAQNHGN